MQQQVQQLMQQQEQVLQQLQLQQLQMQQQQQPQQQSQVQQMQPQMQPQQLSSPLTRDEVPKLRQERAKRLVKKFKELGIEGNFCKNIDGKSPTLAKLVAELYHAWPEDTAVLDVPRR